MDELQQKVIECIGNRHGATKELAEYLGIHPNVITNWKNGRNRSYRNYLPQLATYFDVSVGYLLGNDEQKKLTTQEGDELIKDEFIAFYGEVKNDLDEGDIEDLKIFMRMKAEIKRQKK